MKTETILTFSTSYLSFSVLNRSGIGGNINFMAGGGGGNTEWECRGGNRDVLSFVGKRLVMILLESGCEKPAVESKS